MESTHKTQEDVGSGIDRLGRRRAHGDAEKPADLLHQPLHDTVIIQNVHSEAEEERHRKDLNTKMTLTISSISTDSLPFTLKAKMKPRGMLALLSSETRKPYTNPDPSLV